MSWIGAIRTKTPKVDYPRKVTLIVSLGWFTILLGRESLPPVLPAIIQEYAVSESQVGIALSVMWASYSLLHFPAGQLSDSISRSVILLSSFLIAILGFAVLTVISSYAGILFSLACIGIGAGLYFAPSRSFVTDLNSTSPSQAIGIQDSAGALGSSLAGIMVILVLRYSNWRTHFLSVIALLFVTLILLYMVSTEGRQITNVSLDVTGTFRRIYRRPAMRGILITYATISFAWQSIISFLPLYLITGKSIPSVHATLLYSFLFIVAGIIGPIAGRIADKHSRIAVSLGGLLLSFLGLLVIILFQHVGVIAAGLIITALGIRSYSPAMQSYLFSLSPDEHRGGDFGAIKTLYTGLGSIGPLYVGVVADWYTFDLAFTGVLVLLLGSILVLLRTVD